jgi:hypothetical protein
MEPDDGEWIRAEAARKSPAGDDGRPDEEWPGYGWSAADSAAAAASAIGSGSADADSAGSATGKRWGHGGIPGFSGWVAAAVAVVAATAGVAVGLSLIRGTPSGSAAGWAAPSASAEAPSAPAPAGASGQVRILLTGRVLAVSRTSITIGGAGPSVTAAVTSATRVTGAGRGTGGVRGISGVRGIKAGDEVSAQLTGTAAHLIATAIQDPGSA